VIVFEAEAGRGPAVFYQSERMRARLPIVMDFVMCLFLTSYDGSVEKDFDFSDACLMMANGGYCVLACQSLACPATPCLYSAPELLP